jgi:hypothetical protein
LCLRSLGSRVRIVGVDEDVRVEKGAGHQDRRGS